MNFKIIKKNSVSVAVVKENGVVISDAQSARKRDRILP
jgi:hypothetical protein